MFYIRKLFFSKIHDNMGAVCDKILDLVLDFLPPELTQRKKHFRPNKQIFFLRSLGVIVA